MSALTRQEQADFLHRLGFREGKLLDERRYCDGSVSIGEPLLIDEYRAGSRSEPYPTTFLEFLDRLPRTLAGTVARLAAIEAYVRESDKISA
jgi:hypothetical protein